MIRIAIVVGSTRPGRNARQVAQWVYDIASQRTDATFEIVDLADYDLACLDEPVPAALCERYEHEHTNAWAETVESFDAFIFVTPEYNHSMPGALKVALDFLFREWHDKAAGFVSYGIHGGVRAVEHLRLVMAELKMADVRTQVALNLFTDFEDMSRLRPASHHEATLTRMLDELLAWAGALASLRSATV
jgi:NAD(P)H-dependent FMN reductase